LRLACKALRAPRLEDGRLYHYLQRPAQLIQVERDRQYLRLDPKKLVEDLRQRELLV
jgi:hypothetical protein